jgi:hypothetical protein
MQRFLQMIVLDGEMKTTSGVKVCMVFGVYSTFVIEERAAPDVYPAMIRALLPRPAL